MIASQRKSKFDTYLILLWNMFFKQISFRVKVYFNETDGFDYLEDIEWNVFLHLKKKYFSTVK